MLVCYSNCFSPSFRVPPSKYIILMLNSFSQISLCAECSPLVFPVLRTLRVFHLFREKFSSVTLSGCADENPFQDCFRTLLCHNILVCHSLHKWAMNRLLISHCLTFPDHV